MHPNFAELKTLYDAGSLAVVHAAGVHTESRSHFVSQDMMERPMSSELLRALTGSLGRRIPA